MPLLAQQEHIDHDLGWVGAAISAGVTLTPVIIDLFGGGGNQCTSNILAQRQKLAQATSELLSFDDMNRLTAGMQDRVAPNPQAMAFFATGEGDCVTKNVSSRHQRFLREYKALLTKRAQEKEQAQKQGNSNLPVNMDTSKIAGSQVDPVMLFVAGGSIIAVSVFGYALYKKSQQKK